MELPHIACESWGRPSRLDRLLKDLKRLRRHRTTLERCRRHAHTAASASTRRRLKRTQGHSEHVLRRDFRSSWNRLPRNKACSDTGTWASCGRHRRSCGRNWKCCNICRSRHWAKCGLRCRNRRSSRNHRSRRHVIRLPTRGATNPGRRSHCDGWRLHSCRLPRLGHWRLLRSRLAFCRRGIRLALLRPTLKIHVLVELRRRGNISHCGECDVWIEALSKVSRRNLHWRWSSLNLPDHILRGVRAWNACARRQRLWRLRNGVQSLRHLRNSL